MHFCEMRGRLLKPSQRPPRGVIFAHVVKRSRYRHTHFQTFRDVLALSKCRGLLWLHALKVFQPFPALWGAHVGFGHFGERLFPGERSRWPAGPRAVPLPVTGTGRAAGFPHGKLAEGRGRGCQPLNPHWGWGCPPVSAAHRTSLPGRWVRSQSHTGGSRALKCVRAVPAPQPYPPGPFGHFPHFVSAQGSLKTLPSPWAPAESVPHLHRARFMPLFPHGWEVASGHLGQLPAPFQPLAKALDLSPP